MGAARSKWLLALAALLFGFAVPAPGQTYKEVRGVSISVDTPWPTALGKGYFPFWVELRNGSDERRDVSLSAQSKGWRGPTKGAAKRVALAPGESRVLELYAPSFIQRNNNYGSYDLTVEVGRDRVDQSLGITSSNWEKDLRNVVVFTDANYDPAAAIQLSERLKTGELQRTTYVRTSGGTTKKSAPNVRAELAPFGRMPRAYQGYTSLDAAIVDVRDGLPAAKELETILAWARVGGRVIFLGRGALEVLRDVPDVGESLEDRFEIHPEGEGPGRVFTFGLGVLFFGEVEAGLIESDAEVALVREALHAVHPDVESQSGWVPQQGDWRLSGNRIPIPGVGKIPRRAFMMLLFAFGFVIGPVNFYLLKRLGRPGLLLVTIPAFSIVFSVGLLAYGILHQGVDVKTASRTFTVLDQRTHRAATIEHRAIFVGLSPGPGLRPESGTTVFPEAINDRSERYQVDFDEGLLLSGSYLPVRDPVEHVLLSERAARARLGLRVDGAEVVLQNTFETTLEELYLRSADGAWYATSEAVAPGETVRVGTMMEDDELRPPDALPRGLASWNAMLERRTVPPSCYLAVLSESPFTDDCSLELNELEGRHAVLGILPEKAEDWE